MDKGDLTDVSVYDTLAPEPVIESPSLPPSTNLLEYWANCNVNVDERRHRLTGIVGTIGHRSKNIDTITQMIENGMTIARLDTVKHDHEFLRECIKNIRTALTNINAQNEFPKHVSIALDLGGPCIRTGVLEGGMYAVVKLRKGDTIRLTVDVAYAEKGTAACVYVDYEYILKDVEVGQKLYMDNGTIMLVCKAVTTASVACSVEIGGTLGSRKTVNLPGVVLSLPAVSFKDREFLQLAIDADLDMVFASYVRDSSAVVEIKDLLGEYSKNMAVLAKIQNLQGVENADEIINIADGIVVSRNTLGIELAWEKVFLCQKSLIAKCNIKGKPVMVMSQMLLSMETEAIPHRPDICDVANAILDGADSVVLSTETSNGRYPANCILFMDKVCREAEATQNLELMFDDLCRMTLPPLDGVTAIAISAVEASYKCQAKAIIVVTTSGRSAQLISKYRPNCPIITVSRNPHTCRRIPIARACVPLLYDDMREDNWLEDVDQRVQMAVRFGKYCLSLHVGDPVIIVTPWKQGSGFTNTMRIIYVPLYMEPIIY